ncbi:MAG: hypothetical protein J7M32_09705 [Deltaproteobacteria bacterium]|nr:hypothetical protein [Deltaproteobacteria bacterium]
MIDDISQKEILIRGGLFASFTESQLRENGEYGLITSIVQGEASKIQARLGKGETPKEKRSVTAQYLGEAQ